MNEKSKTKNRKTNAVAALPMLSDEQVEQLKERWGKYGLRCFFGIHKKVTYLWPTGDRLRASLDVICFRCGEALAYKVLPSRKPIIARTIQDLEAAPKGYAAVDKDLLVYTKPFHSSNEWLLAGVTGTLPSSSIALPARLYPLTTEAASP